tara:strand:+ start:61 stop:408 length:348 start_codon:yes stop_codon:yes gene_type:complete
MKKNLSLEIIKDERKKSRIDKISTLIKKTISEVFLTFDLNYDNGKNIFIMVSHVELSSDGKSAKVFLETVNNFSFDYEQVVEIIAKNSSRIKKEFSSKIELRYTPKLKFELINNK